MAAHMGASSVEDLFMRVPSIAQRLGNLHSMLVEQGTISVITHSTPARALAVGASQKTLVAHIHKDALRTLRSTMDDDAAAILRSASGPAAGAFLEVPLDDRWVMADSRFATSCRRRLGL